MLAHDHLVSKSASIALPASHGLRISVERHKARLAAEFTRARIRRKCASVAALRNLLSAGFRADEGLAPRWLRINTVVATLEEQLSTTLAHFSRVGSVGEVMSMGGGGADDDAGGSSNLLYVDEHVPDLVAISHGVDLSKTEAYKTSAIILQDKASCFPAYLLDPPPGGGDVIDACAAPGNKTTHLAAILHSKAQAQATTNHAANGSGVRILAFERNAARAEILEQRSRDAGAGEMVHVRAGQDFLKTNPKDKAYENVTALLLDPSCSGSGMLNRDYMPELHLPSLPTKSATTAKAGSRSARKRKQKDDGGGPKPSQKKQQHEHEHGAGSETAQSQTQPSHDPTRLEALAAFQLAIITHAFSFPAARRITYSTCSIHDEENEHVAAAALASGVAKQRGWRPVRRDEQVDGMRRWDVRGRPEACAGHEDLAEACIRSFPGDGRGVMGFFAVGFVRD